MAIFCAPILTYIKYAPFRCSKMTIFDSPKWLCKKSSITSRPVSRVLYGCASCPVQRDGHSSETHIATCLMQSTRVIEPKHSMAQLALAIGHPYLILLPMGFSMPDLLPDLRWALTPPFHPYLLNSFLLK